MTRVLRRSPLVFPTGVAPGFNPSHVGARGAQNAVTLGSLVFTMTTRGVANNINFTQLGINKQTTVLSAGVGGGGTIDGIIGPCGIMNSSVTSSYNFTLNTTAVPSKFTWAALLLITGTQIANGSIIGMDPNGGSQYLGFNASNDLTVAIGSAPTIIASTLVCTSGHYYFVAASGTTGAWNFLTRDLRTGALQTGTAATAATPIGTVVDGFLYQDTATPSGGSYNLAATMINTAYALNMQELIAWSADPWAFWYPDAARQSRALKGAAAITAFSMTASTGNYTLAGENLALLKKSIENIQSGSYALTDEQLTLKKASKLSVQETPYTLTGEQVTALKKSIANIQEGAYTTSSQPVLKKTSLQNIQEVPYALTGENEALNKGSKASIQEGAYSVTGEQVTALKKSVDKLQTGTYATSSQPVFKKTNLLNAQVVPYTLNSGVDDARSFNGTSDIISIGTPSVLDITSNITLACWVYANSLPAAGANFMEFFEKGFDGANQQYFLRFSGEAIGGTPTGNYLQVGTFSPAVGAQLLNVAVTNTWIHIAGTYDGTHWNIYFNGSNSGQSQVGTTAPIHTTAQVSIGGAYINGSPARFLNGNMADAAIWNTNLTGTQISNLASGQRANTIGANANLVGYWPIVGQSPEPDKSGNGNDGTLTGTAVVSGPPALDPVGGVLGNETLLWKHLLNAQMTPYALTGESLTIAIPGNFSMSIGSGTYTLTDNNLTLTRTSKLSAQSVTYALTVEQLALLKASKDFPQAGFYTATGENVTLKAARLGNAQSGSYSLTGGQERLLKTSSGNIQSGFYSLTGESTKLSASRKGSIQAGTYALTDEALTLLKTSKLLASAGNYNLTGENLNLRAARLLLPQMTPFALTGESLTITLTVTSSFTMSIGSGAYSLTDENLTLLKASKQGLQVGLYSLTDAQLALLRGARLSGTSGAYTLTGNVLTLKATHLAGVQSGLYGLTGNNLALFTGTPPSSFTLTARVTLIGVDDISKLLAVDDISKLFGGA